MLIVDDESMRNISSCLGMYDIMEQGVTLVEPVYLRREPQPQMEAVYYLEPSEASINALIQDFEDDNNQYLAVHLIFTKRLPDALLERLKGSQVKQKLRLLRELYLDYLVPEKCVFHLDMEQALWNMFSPNSGSEKDLQLRRIVDKLLTVFATLNQMPIIRFASSSALTNSIATLLNEKLVALSKSIPSWPAKSDKPRPVLLILDRSFDMISPFLHELTYQAMCQVFLYIHNQFSLY